MRNIRSPILILLLVLLLPTCAASYENTIFDSLTEEEMAFPPGRYQIGIDINCQGRVKISSPEIEPVLVSTVIPEKYIEEVLVDGENGTWFAVDQEYDNSTICRLNPDGSVDWKLTYTEPPYEITFDDDESNPIRDNPLVVPFVCPVVALNGAMVVYIGWDYQYSGNGENKSVYTEGGPYAYLECVDLSGNVRWRTAPAGYDKLHPRAWRVSETEIAMVSSEFSFDVFSIADGSFIQQVYVPGFSPHTLTGPIPLDDGRWIIHGDNFESDYWNGYPYIYCVNPDGSYSWELEFQTYSFSFPVMLSDQNILYYGNRNGLRAINPDDGEILWRWWGGSHRVAGIRPDGNIVMIGTDYEQGSVLGLATPEGDRLWPVDVKWPIDGADDVIIYNDGNILFADETGVKLVDTDGSIMWHIDISEFGVTSSEPTVYHMKINPTSDGGLVVKNHNMDTDNISDDALYIFKQP